MAEREWVGCLGSGQGVHELFDLTGQTAAVTGAASGLGAAFAEAMAECGANVACIDQDAPGCEKTTEHVRELGVQGLAVPCDVSDENEVARAFSTIVDRFGGLGISINNAGISDPVQALVHEYETEHWNAVRSVNLDGVFYCCREALKPMVEQRRGKIINTASMWGLAGSSSVAPLPAYSASKGGVVNLTRELALQYAPYGIQVNAICPGFVRTGLAGDAYDDPGFVDAVNGFTPMGRYAEPTELKGTAVYLSSSASDYTTGLMLVTDGGCLAK